MITACCLIGNNKICLAGKIVATSILNQCFGGSGDRVAKVLISPWRILIDMKRMLRHPLVMLMLCMPSLLTGMMAVRSYFHSDWLLWASPQQATPTRSAAAGRYVISDGGVVVIGMEDATWIGPSPVGIGRTFTSPAGLSLRSYEHPFEIISYGFWGDNYVDSQLSYTNHERFVRIPWWAIFVGLLSLATPTMLHFLRQRRRRFRDLNKLCPNCGYDTRATPEKCPECGHLGKPQVRYSRSRA